MLEQSKPSSITQRMKNSREYIMIHFLVPVMRPQLTVFATPESANIKQTKKETKKQR